MKKLICSVLILMLAKTSLPVGAQNTVLDDALFYAEPIFYEKATGVGIDSVIAGDIECRYAITNQDDSDKNITVLMGMYDGDVLKQVDSKTYTLSKEEGRVYKTGVTATDSSSVIRLFVLDDGAPVRLAAVLSGTPRGCDVKAFALGDYAAEINNDSGRIDLLVPNTLNLNTVPSVTLAEGAEAVYDSNDFSQPVTMTVTAANGDSKIYRIYASVYADEFTLDFESDTLNAAPDGWETFGGGACPVTVVTDPNGGTNQVLKLEDNSNVARAAAAYSFADIKLPFKVSYRICYGHDDAFNANGPAIIYYWTSVDNRDEGENATQGHDNGALSDISAHETENGIVWRYEYYSTVSNRAVGISTNTALSMNEWYDVDITYKDDGTVEYYINNNLLARATMRSNEPKANQFYATTRNANTGYMYLDDITVKPLGAADTPEISMNFENTAQGELLNLDDFSISGSGRAEIVGENGSNALKLTGEKILATELADLQGEAEFSFDLTLPNSGDSLEVNVGNGAELILSSDNSGKLNIGYVTAANGVKTIDTELDADVVNSIKVLSCYNEDMDKNMIILYVGGKIEAVYSPASDVVALDAFSIAVTGGTALLDNLSIK